MNTVFENAIDTLKGVFATLEAEVRSLSQINSATETARANLANLQKIEAEQMEQRQRATADIAVARAQVQTAEDTARQTVAKARADAVTIVGDAHRDADAIRKKAQDAVEVMRKAFAEN